MYKVVLIDDDPITLKTLAADICWTDHDCEIAGAAQDGKAGLCLIRDSHPDMMIADIAMDNMDGLRMIGGARAEYPDMRITILTRSRNIEDAQEAVKLGVDRYILKPFRNEEVEEAVAAMKAKLDSATAMRRVALRSGARTDTPAAGKIVKIALDYIKAHYNRKLYLQDVADQAYVSQWYLSRLLHKETGRSFPDLLNSIRIEKAKELLADPELRISYIAVKVGFSDPAHFARAFRREAGMSANEYRRKVQNKAETIRM